MGDCEIRVEKMCEKVERCARASEQETQTILALPQASHSVYGQDNENRIGRVFITKSYFSMADES